MCIRDRNNVSPENLQRSWNKLLERNEQLYPSQIDGGEEHCTSETVYKIIHMIPGCEDVTKRGIKNA